MIEAWNYDSGVFKGQSIGIHNSATGEIDKLLSVECFHGGEEVKRIVINLYLRRGFYCLTETLESQDCVNFLIFRFSHVQKIKFV